MELATSVSIFRANAFENQKPENSFTRPGAVIGLNFARGPTAAVYFQVEDPAGLVDMDPLGPFVPPPGYTVPVPLRPLGSLVPGTYTGTARILACADTACTSRYATTGGDLPYELTVTPQLQADVFANGTPWGAVKSGDFPMSRTLGDGGSIEIRSSIPVQVMYSSGLAGMVQVTVDPASTSQIFRATLQRDTSVGGVQQITFNLVPADWSLGTQKEASVTVEVTP